MKPETKFKRAVVKLGKAFGLELVVSESISGYSSADRCGFVTFSAKTEQTTQPSADFISQLDALNNAEYSGTHALSGLPAKVTLAVRYITFGNARHSFVNGQLSLVA